MNIIMKNVSDLIPYVNNPRKNDKAVDIVASSIKNYGFKVPIIVDVNNEIVTGHTRLKAAKKLGMNVVPCIIADDLTQSQIKAYRIADNKVAEAAEWDYDLLKLELVDIDDFTGFNLQELNNELDYSNKNKEIDFDDIEEEYELKLKFTEKEYFFVREKLNEIDGDMKEALLKVLEYEI